MLLCLQYIEDEHPLAEEGQRVSICFSSSSKYIELKLDAPQDDPHTGWIIKPHMKPCTVSVY